MRPYLELLAEIFEKGSPREDRTGVGTRSLFGAQVRYPLDEGFPLITTKKMFWRGIVVELLWFLRGETNIDYLQKRKVHIWDEWADEKGELGPVYGKQWRAWQTADGQSIDQISRLIDGIRRDPYSRRHIVNAWNVGELDQMRLAPCHVMTQFYVQDGTLSCQLYQRSGDFFLGVPFNIASYALLTLMIAHVTDLRPGVFVHTLGDAHIYNNHLEQVQRQLARSPRPLPRVTLNPDINDIFDFCWEDITLSDYEPYPAIKAPVAV